VLKLARAPALGAFLFARAIIEQSRTAAFAIGGGITFFATVFLMTAFGPVRHDSGWFHASVPVGASALIAALIRWPRGALKLLLVAGVAASIAAFRTDSMRWPVWSAERWRTIALVAVGLLLLSLLVPASSAFSRFIREKPQEIRRWWALRKRLAGQQREKATLPAPPAGAA
jgi:hypothetical protein